MQSLTVAEQQEEKIWGAETKEKSFSGGILKESREGVFRRKGERASRSWWVAFTDVLAPCALTSTGQPLDYGEDLEKTSCSMSSKWRLVSYGLVHPHAPTCPVPAPLSLPPSHLAATSAGYQPAGSGARLKLSASRCAWINQELQLELTWVCLPRSAVGFHQA